MAAVDLVVELETTHPDRHMPLRLLDRLLAQVRRDPACLTSEQFVRLARCLARERFSPVYGDVNALVLRLDRFRRILLAAGESALDAARWLMDYEPRANSDREPSWSLDMLAGRGVALKLIGMELLTALGRESEIVTFADQVAQQSEGLWVKAKVAAQLVWEGPSEAAEPFLEQYLTALVTDYTATTQQYCRLLAEAGPALVKPLIRRLSDPDYRIRHRAALVLAAIGQPAVPDLVELIRRAPSFEAVQNAEEALRAINPREVAAARQQREADARMLTRADPPGADAGRGVSRPDEQPN